MLIFLLSILSLMAFGETCTETLTIGEILNRSITHSIDINLKTDEIDIIRGHIIDAEKIYNPELEHFTTDGKQQGKTTIASETRLWFNFQLGNKRKYKGEVFRTQKDITKAELEYMRLVLKKELFLAFIRNKQILNYYTRIDNIHNLIESFINRYQSIKFLTPEQKIEKNSLEISVVNLDLHKAELKNEIELIGRFFQRMIRSECEITLKINNPTNHNEWPEIQSKTYKGENSLELKLADLALSKSKFELKREEAMVWPDLKIGPMWQFNRLGSLDYNLYGVGLIFPIPSFNLNQGMKQASRASITRNQKRYDYMLEQKRKEFDFRVKRYTDVLKEMKDYRKLNEFGDIIKETRSLFNRGLISIPIFLSYKNEFLEVLTRSQNLENILAQHLMEIYIINNEPLEEIGNSYLAI
ncbi:TolC family protein [Peredibacter sp. HCB2-198]|uniref:TolC family protein n=1 Tax=Peredibacter sp. HCB2-198 TaxID=3383025 RepID=UPI0038B4DB9F